MALCLSVDIGTSSLKGALVSDRGEIEYFKQVFYADIENFNSFKNFPLKLWERAFFITLQDIIKTSSQRIHVICLSANAPSLIGIDSEGKALEPIIHHLGRVKREEKTISFYISGLKAFKKEYPKIYNSVSTFLTVSEYFVYLLTGEKVTATPCKNYNSYFWSQSELKSHKLDFSKMAPFVLSGTFVGRTKNIFSFMKERIPVVLAGIDYLSCLIGMGAIEEGMLTDRAGTSEGFNLCQKQSLQLDQFYCLPQLPQGLWNIGSVMSHTCIAIDYTRYSSKELLTYQQTLRHILSMGPYHSIFYLSPKAPLWNFQLKDGIFRGSSQLKTNWALLRSRLEAIGFSLRAIYEEWKSSKLKVNNSIRVSGGQSKVALWNALKADLIGMPVEYMVCADAELLGNAILGFLGMGIFDNLEQGVEAMIRVQRVYEPSYRLRHLYKDKYEKFKQLSQDNWKE